jgi:RNA polymerase sigma-70 factor (ECF subfamily)
MTQKMHSLPSNSEFGRLIHESRHGAEGSLNQICEQLMPKVSQLCRGRLGYRLRPKSAESDLVQETLLGVSEGFASFRGQTQEELFAWVARIVDGKTYELQRRYLHASKRDATREKPLMPGDSANIRPTTSAGADNPFERLVSAEDALRVQAMIAELPGHYGQVIRLRHVEDLAFSEIAVQLGRTEPAVKNIYVRAMKAMEARLEQNLP